MANPSIAQPLWWDAIRPPALSMRPVPQRCDVAIVGAGFAGLSAALMLARAGRDVHVFDRQRPGEGASTRGLGVAHSRLSLSPDALTSRFGDDRAAAMLREAAEAQVELGRFISAEGVDCLWQPTGLLVAASRHQHLAQLIREAEALHTHAGIQAEPLTAGALPDVIGGGGYRGGLRRPDAASFHPARLHAAMLALARQAGATVHGETGVSRIHHNSMDKYELWTLRGPTLARDVIITSGASTDRVSPWLRRRLVPTESTILSTQPLDPDLISQLLPGSVPMMETRRLRHVVRTSPEGNRLLISGRSQEPDRAIAADAALQRDVLEEIFPAIRGTEISHVWKATFAGNRDGIPRLFSREGVHYAVAQDDSVVWNRWFGLQAARQVLGQTDTESAFSGRPPRALPLYSGKPWFAPLTLAWQRLADQLDARREQTGE